MPLPVSRVEAVQALRALAAKYGVDRVPDRASRARVGTMVDELLAVETLSVEDKAQVEEAVAQHAASYGQKQEELKLHTHAPVKACKATG